MYKNPNDPNIHQNRTGIVLMVTLVLLVVLSTLAYTLTTYLSAQRHRQQYIIDYQIARYGCDSAVKYALATLEIIGTPSLVDRPNEPDFSDLFRLSETEYKKFLDRWFAQNARSLGANLGDSARLKPVKDTNDANKVTDIDDINDFNDVGDFNQTPVSDSNSLTVRGPYGSPWPLVTEPIEFEIGSAKVKIVIEDENAKYPLGWLFLDDESGNREAVAGFEGLCEWMGIGYEQIDSLKLQFDEVDKIKRFKLDFGPVKATEKVTSITVPARGRRRGRAPRSVSVKRTLPASVHVADFARLFNSSMIDIETLARPTIVSASREESALKYLGMFASNKVNINTAPRHVLEAAFTFGGDADRIAEEIIQRRRIVPFKSIEDLRKSLLRYSGSVGKCEKFITASSDFFTIRITAVSGVAKASAVIAVSKNGKKLERIAVLSD